MRVVTQKARELNQRLISSLVGDLRALARVVYCQRLPDGRYGVGIQFQGQSINWPAGSIAGASN
jgi:Lon protease-like protein